MHAVQVLRSPTAILESAHVQVIELLARYVRLGRGEIRKRNRLSLRIQKELRIHLEIEEVLFYPALQELNAALVDRGVTRALQDHREMKALLQELSELGSGSRFDLKMKALRRCVKRHVELEGLQMLSHAGALPEDTLQDLSNGMEKLLERLRRNEKATNPRLLEQTPFYPSLRDHPGAREDDRGTPGAFTSPGESDDRYPSEYYGWESL
jgi:hypothetical protein